MSQQIDLTISSNYVRHWTYVEAIRELFQNALDAQIEDSDNVTNHLYKDNTLTISSPLSVLERDTLLLGCSNKQDDDRTIGQFGEGYKIALMVLLREGFCITIVNAKADEVWLPEMKHSDVFNQKILSILIGALNVSYEDEGLTFHIIGVTPAHMEALKKANLNMQDTPREAIPSSYGDILKDESQARRLYVSGLFVETSKVQLQYGYDFHPDCITLDRDRHAIGDYDLLWTTSQIWAESTDYKTVLKMLQDDVPDVSRIPNVWKNIDQLTDYAYAAFIKEHGPNTVPVTSQEEYDRIKAFGHYTPVFCPEALKQIVTSHRSYRTPIDRRASMLKPHVILVAALLDQNGKVHAGVTGQIPRLIEMSKKWESLV